MYRFWHSVTRPLLDTLQPVSIVEIGVAHGHQTELLLPYAQQKNIRVHCIDTVEPEALKRWQSTYPASFTFHHAASIEALPLIQQYDVVLIDGDHNWYTLHAELLLIEKHAQRTGTFPVVLMHDIGWPYGRRDLYYNPDTIPTAYLQPYAQGGLQRGTDALSPDGFNARLNHALVSGGPRNGILTAVEDFLQETSHALHWVAIQGMHGLGILLPQALLEQNNALKTLLQSFTPAPELQSFIETLENDRIASQMNAEAHQIYQYNFRLYDKRMVEHLSSAEKRLQDMEQERKLEQQRAEEERTKLQETEAIVHRMTNSRSWRITAPLRKITQLPALRSLKRTMRELPVVVKNMRRKTTNSLSGSPLVRGLGEKQENVRRPIKSIDVIIVYKGNTVQLKSTLKSIAVQSVEPVRVIIADTTQEPAAQLREFLSEARYSIEMIKISYISEFAFHTRVRSGGSDYMVHAMAGTVFGETYFEDCLTAMRNSPGAGFAYCDYRIIETGVAVATPASIDEYQEKTAGFLHQCCMVGRDAMFHAWTVTGRGDPEKLWPAILMEGWTAVKAAGRIDVPAAENYENTSPLVPLLPRATLCLSLSGRQWAWPMMQQFLERQTYPHERIHIVILDTSQDEPFGKIIRSWLESCDYREHTYLRETVGIKGIADMPRHIVEHQMSDACAVIYNRLARMCSTPVAFVLEEDVIPPDDAFMRLQSLHREGVVSVSGVYRHRQLPRLIAWDWNQDGFPVPRPFMGTGVTTIGGNGFGCVLIDGPYFRKTVLRSGAPIRNFDHNFYHQAVHLEKRTALIDWSIVCKHYMDKDHWVSPR